MSSKLYIDVRHPSEIAGKKIKGVELYPYVKILEDKESFYEFCAKASEVVLICRSGRRSALVRAMLLAKGMDAVETRTPKAVRKVLEDE